MASIRSNSDAGTSEILSRSSPLGEPNGLLTVARSELIAAHCGSPRIWGRYRHCLRLRIGSPGGEARWVSF